MADTKLTGLTEISTLAIDDQLYIVDKSDTTDDAAGSSRRVQVDRLGGFVNPGICTGRLPVETGVQVSTTDQTAKTSVFFTPYNGNRIAVFDGTRWELYTFSQLTLALGTLTNAKNYDVFIFDNSGTLTLELSAAWTNDTTRADALTTQDGVQVKSGATTRRYLGTIRTTSTTTTEDSLVKRFVYNQSNRIPRKLFVKETTNSWTYAVADTWRQARASTANQVELVVGLREEPISLKLTVAAVQQNGAGNYCCTSIGEDSTTTPHTEAGIGLAISNSASAIAVPGATILEVMPSAIGYHKYCWLELTGPGGTGTFYSESGGSPELRRSVLCGFVHQ